jgi:TP901 family phage tail tape measure protein
MATERELVLKIAGEISKTFEKSIKLAEGKVYEMGSAMHKTAEQADIMQKVMGKRSEVDKAREQYDKAQKKVSELSAKMQGNEKVTASMNRQYENACHRANDYKAKIDTLNSELSEYEKKTNTAGKATKELERAQQRHLETLEKQQKAIAHASKYQALGEQISQSGKNMRLSGVTSIAEGYGLLKLATKPLKDVTEFSAQTAQLSLLTDQAETLMQKNLELSQSYSASIETLQKLEALGIKAGTVDAKNAQQIFEYADNVYKASEALGMSAEAVGNAYNQFNDQLTGDTEKTKALFDTINSVSKVAQADAETLIATMQGSATVVKSFTSLTNEQIVGLSAAFAKMSSSASAATTSQTLFIKALTAGKGATKKQLEGWNRLGISAEKLALAMNGGPESAQAAISEVLTALNKLPQAEKQVALSSIFGKNQELLATLDKLASNKAGYFDLGMNSATADNTGSVQRDSGKIENSTAKQQEILNNNLKALSVIIGQELLPVWNQLLAIMVKSLKAVADFAKQNSGATKAIIGIIGVMGSLKIILGVSTYLIGGLVSIIGKSVYIYGLARKAILVYNGTLAASSVCMKVAIALAKGLAAMFHLQTYKVIALTVAQKAMSAAMLVASGVMKALAVAGRVLNLVLLANPIGLIIGLIGGLIAAGVWLYQNWDTVKEKAAAIWGWFAKMFPGVAGVITNQIGRIIDTLKSVWENIKFVFSNIIDFVKNVFTGNWSDAWENVKNIFVGVFSSLGALIKLPINGIIEMINLAFSKIGSISLNIPDWIPGIGGEKYSFALPQIPLLANGGIATAPTLAMIGEGAESEAVLPLSRLDSLLSGGAQGSANSSNVTVNFNPQITISGSSDDDAYAQVKRALNEGSSSLRRELERMFADRARLSYV